MRNIVKISQNGIDIIKYFEGFSSKIYQDSAGFPTIGYGHLIKNNEDYSNNINKNEAENILRQDIASAENAIIHLIKQPLNQNQFDALSSFTFNLGGGALQRSTLRRTINRGDHSQAPKQFMRWIWAGGHKLNGLIKRRHIEAKLYQA